jgi:hypothetical protein
MTTRQIEMEVRARKSQALKIMQDVSERAAHVYAHPLVVTKVVLRRWQLGETGRCEIRVHGYFRGGGKMRPQGRFMVSFWGRGLPSGVGAFPEGYSVKTREEHQWESHPEARRVWATLERLLAGQVDLAELGVSP